MIHSIFEAHFLLIAAAFFSTPLFTIQHNYLRRRFEIDTIGRRKKGWQKKSEFSARHSGVLKTGTFRWFNADSVVHPHAKG